ncbi:MAG: TraV family lipoprotein [Litorimonas sp.]
MRGRALSRIRSIGLVALAAMTLPGCASLASAFEDDFECPVQTGIACADIRTIQDRIVQPGLQVAPAGLPVPAGHDFLAGQADVAADRGDGAIVPAPGIPRWTPGTVMEIHVAGFVDSDNLLHADSVVYALIDPGGWAAARGGE